MLIKQGRIWIIIVNYRTPDLVIDCLRSLSAQIQNLGNPHVDVVDNNSGDDSVEKLNVAIRRENWQSWTGVVPLERNGGFAFGNNASIRTALSRSEPPEFIILLNPDTVVLPDSISNLVSFMDTHAKAGIAGSQLKNSDGHVDSSAHIFPSPLGELEDGARFGYLSRLLKKYVVTPPAQPVIHQCDWVSGACMIIRRQLIENIGLMDEKYFLYFEEVDFCRRARLSGWQCWHVPESCVMHLEGASTGINTAKKRRAGYWYDSRRRFFVKHYGILGLIAADILWATGRTTYLLRKGLRLANRNSTNIDPKWYMFDLLWGDLKAILTGQAWNIRQSGKQA